MGTYNDEWNCGLGIENIGVSPDVEVDNDPMKEFLGEDEQLTKGVEVLRDMVEKEWSSGQPQRPPDVKKVVDIKTDCS